MDVPESFQEIYLWLAYCVLLILLGFFANYKGFFKTFTFSNQPIVYLKDVIMGFGLFIFLFALAVYLDFLLTAENSISSQMTNNFKLLVKTILPSLAGLTAIGLFNLNQENRTIFHHSTRPWYKELGTGIKACLLVCPFVLVFSLLVSSVLSRLIGYTLTEQNALEVIREAKHNYYLLGGMFLIICIAIPIIEEFLFRGLLQSWLKRPLKNPIWFIGISSLIFSLCHYSAGQGMSNIHIVASILVMGIALGITYERQRSLWASIGLHSTFNFCNFLLFLNSY